MVLFSARGDLYPKKGVVMNYLRLAKINSLMFVLMLSPVSLMANDFYDYSGWYAGGRFGFSSNEKSCLDDRISCDKTDTGYGIFAGYDFSQRYGIEFSWNDIGDSSARYQSYNLDGKLKETDLALRISHALNKHVRIYGKVGAAFWDGEVLGGPEKLDDSGVRPLVGAGLEFPFSHHWSGRIEYQYIDKVGNSEMGYTNPNFLGVALVWHFSAPPKPAPKIVPQPEPKIVVVKEPEPEPVEQRITVDEQVGGPLFEFDKAEIRNTAAIDQVVKILTDHPGLNVSITGHTDSRGKAEYNQRLSEKRADVVAKYLAAKGVAANRIKTAGMGESVPVANNDTDAGRAKNRRVEFIISGTKTNP